MTTQGEKIAFNYVSDACEPKWPVVSFHVDSIVVVLSGLQSVCKLKCVRQTIVPAVAERFVRTLIGLCLLLSLLLLVLAVRLAFLVVSASAESSTGPIQSIETSITPIESVRQRVEDDDDKDDDDNDNDEERNHDACRGAEHRRERAGIFRTDATIGCRYHLPHGNDPEYAADRATTTTAVVVLSF